MLNIPSGVARCSNADSSLYVGNTVSLHYFICSRLSVFGVSLYIVTYYIFFSLSFTLYPAYNRISRVSLVVPIKTLLSHTFHRILEALVAEFNAALYLDNLYSIKIN